MPRCVPAGWLMLALAAIGPLVDRPLGFAAGDPQPAAAVVVPDMQVLHTPGGTRFGLFGAKPASPAPTVFVMASTIEAMAADRGAIFTAAGADLSRDGWLYVTLDLPCHGADQIDGEPAELSGWAHRVSAGQNLFGPFTKRCSDVLDFLIAEGYTDPDRVGATGTSRGGLSALQFAAAEKRVRAVATISPVTDPLALREFADVDDEHAKSIAALSLVEALAGRPVGITMGNDDARVNTDSCIAFARELVAVARKQHPDQTVVPVELIVGPAAGHTAINGAYPAAARFLRQHVTGSAP